MTCRKTALQWLVALAAFASLPAQEAAAPAATRTLQLRVLDQDGKPIVGAGAVVGALHTVTTDDALQRPASTSDRDGNLSISVPVQRPTRAGSWLAILVAAPAKRSIVINTWSDAWASLGTVYLFPAATLRGRVNDSDGKPLAGARVEVMEPTVGSFCGATVTDAHGIYALAGAPLGCSAVTCSKAGYYSSQLFPVFVDTAVSVALERSGFVCGMVVGAPASATAHLVGGDTDAVVVPPEMGADGSFRLPISGRGRVHVGVHDGDQWIGKSPELRGPVEGLEVVVTTIRLRLRATCEGKPLPAFTVSPLWQPPKIDGGGWSMQVPRWSGGFIGRDGVAEFAVSGHRRPSAFGVSAPDCIAGVAVNVTGADIVCDLRRGAAVTGRVTDLDGKPVAGARVFLQGRPAGANLSGNFRMPPGAALTDATGQFRIGGVCAGRFFLQVDHRDYAVPASFDVDVAENATVATTAVQLRPLGAIVGRLRSVASLLRGGARTGGMVGLPGSTVKVMRGNEGFTYSSDRPIWPVAPAADGAFAIEGLSPVPLTLVLLLPPSHPSLPPIELPLGTFTPGPAEQVIDVGEARVATIAGRATCNLPDATRAWRVFAVVANDSPLEVAAGCADVGSDGRYALRVAPGRYRLCLYDLITRTRLAAPATEIDAAGGETATVDFAPLLQAVTLTLEPTPATSAALHGHLCIVGTKDDKGPRNALLPNADHLGVPLPVAQRSVTVALPAGEFAVYVEGFADGPDKLLGNEGFEVGNAPVRVAVELAALKTGTTQTGK